VIAREADVRVFYPDARYPSWFKPRSRSYQELDASYCPPDVKTNYYPFAALPVISRPWNGRMAARVLMPHVREFAPDLVFGCFIYPDSYAALKIGQALSVPVVAMSIGSDINRIGDPISELHTRAVLRKADFLVTVCNDLRIKAIAMGASEQKSRAIINGCDLSVFYVRDRLEARKKFGLDPAAEIVVYMGRLDVKKGLRELVEAVASLHPARPNLHVYMVGEGPDRPIIQGAIAKVGGESYIHAQGACTPNDVAIWMAAADVVTLPSYMEGCPNVVVEALACGRPVVATNVGGIPEILSRVNGRLVQPREPKELAEALAWVLDLIWDPTAISAHGSKSWNTGAAELMEVFESVLKKRRVAAHGS
jgi:glycosyltransferase involved in cell wall biosynthesis